MQLQQTHAETEKKRMILEQQKLDNIRAIEMEKVSFFSPFLSFAFSFWRFAWPISRFVSVDKRGEKRDIQQTHIVSTYKKTKQKKKSHTHTHTG